MAPTAPEFLKQPARWLRNYVMGHIEYQYIEVTLFTQNVIRRTKEAVHTYTHNTAPMKDATGLHKVPKGYKTMRTKDASSIRAKTRANNSDRIDKNERFRRSQEALRVREIETERKRVWDASEQQLLAFNGESKLRAARRSEDARLFAQFKARTQAQTSTVLLYVPEQQPTTDHTKELRVYDPTSDSAEGRAQKVHAALESILGPERMALGVGLPSGHSGLEDDPVLAKYNQDRCITNVLTQHQQQQAMQRQRWEEQQRLAAQQWEEQQRFIAEQEAERAQKVMMFEHHFAIYKEQVHALCLRGPSFTEMVTKLVVAFDNGDLSGLQQAVGILTNGFLEPIYAALESMKQSIALEQLGALELKNAWPLEGIDHILTMFDDASAAHFSIEFRLAIGYMLQGLRAVCQPVLNAQPMPDLFSSAGPAKSSTPQQQQQVVAAKPPQPQQASQNDHTISPPGVNAGKNFSSFAAFAAATSSPPKDQNQPPVSVLANASAPRTSSNPKTDTMASYMDNNILDFQANNSRLIRDGHVSTAPRKDNEAILEAMYALSGGETGFLGPNDGNGFKREVQVLIGKIGNLKNRTEKNKKTTRDLDVLAHHVLDLWA